MKKDIVRKWFGLQRADEPRVEVLNIESNPENKFYEILHEQLKNPTNMGKWILCSKDGILAEGHDEMAYYDQYRDQIRSGEMFVGRVQPEHPDVVHTAGKWIDAVVHNDLKDVERLKAKSQLKIESKPIKRDPLKPGQGNALE